MSEPRKLNTGDAQQSQSLLNQQQYEEARRAAQRAAASSARQRRTQSFPRIQQSDLDAARAATAQAVQQPAQPEQQATQAVQQPAQPAQQATRAVQQPAQPEQQATRAVRQQVQPEQQATRAVRQPAQPEQQVAQAAQQPAQPEQQPAQPAAAQETQPTAARPARQPGQGAPRRIIRRSGTQPAPAPAPQPEAPRQGQAKPQGQPKPQEQPKPQGQGAPQGAQPAPAGGKGGQKPPKPGKKAKKKKKNRWWIILLATLAVLALIFFGAIAIIQHAIAPEAGTLSVNSLINTPKEYQGKELNLVVVGIDRSEEDGTVAASEVNDGNTDMILYVHYNKETGELKMLQIPRDMMVTTDRSVSGNFRINNVAKTQAAEANSMNMAALCQVVADTLQVPVDGWISIRMEMLVEMVDYFGGIELTVPFEIDYTKVNGGGSSHLYPGYQTVRGDAVEFLLRARKTYADSDITRLKVQRQFYSALFRRLKDIDNIWDVARLAPVVLSYMETDQDLTTLVSFCISMLKIDSSKIMICTLPVCATGPEAYYYPPDGTSPNGEAVIYPARQAAAEILNEYFRDNTGYVDASELQMLDSVANRDGTVYTFANFATTDPSVQILGDIMAADADAQVNDNLDGSNLVDYGVDPDAAAGAADSQADPAA